jgi:hypothetical protein
LQAERAKLLEDTGGEPSSETGELRLQRELVSKTKRSYHNLEVYIREVTLRRDGELDQARKEIKRLATERVQAEEKARIEAGLKDEHLKTVQAKLQVGALLSTPLPTSWPPFTCCFESCRQAQLSSDHLSDAHSAIIEVLKEEMHILKSSFQRQVQALKEMDGKDIWLIGGGAVNKLFLEAGLIDKIILTKIPVEQYREKMLSYIYIKD